MARLSFDIPDALLTRIIDALAQRYHWQAVIGTDAEGKAIPNPVSKAQFARRVVADWLTDQVILAETETEQEQIRATKRATKETLMGQIT